MAQTPVGTRAAARRILAPLALAQFICSFAGSNMNVMINDMSEDLDTTVQGIQVAITLFLLVMAALMIPASKLTDRFGRKRLFIVGLGVYGVGAIISAIAPNLGVLILGNSLLEGIGTALLIPPVYILTTLRFQDLRERARAFGVISALGGMGAAAGPLIGGIITTAIDWRAAFVFQALVIVLIIVLARRVDDPIAPDPGRSFDVLGALLSAIGLVALVMGILALDDALPLAIALLVFGAAMLAWFMFRSGRLERAGREPLVSPALFRNRGSNTALLTQVLQWMMLMGVSFVVAAYLQVVRGYNAIETGIIFTAATVGLLASSLSVGRLVRRFAQRTLVVAGFALTSAGIAGLIFTVAVLPGAWAFAPGLLGIGLGLGLMLTPSVNLVQSAFPEGQQGEISGVSRAVSNLGSSLGTAVAGTILVAGLVDPSRSYALAMIVLGVLGLLGVVLGLRLPREEPAAEPSTK
ncbi:MFS transporter [Agromyces sp. Marseille-P2726]|uniref:MFS transporter n=1 Tax=Agromyces sp. Marseille-P2726 TaxID=2709132 RepID=UPI00156D47A6|nr:MFS transporter [Agromyces sp. Marseille-P2726]